MPKKAVAIFFLLAFVGAALFVYFTFPRTKDEIPKSNNQQPLIPPGSPNTPNGVPVPESVPQPNTPKLPAGPTLHVMAWATAIEARRLSAMADAFEAATGRRVALTITPDRVSYRRELPQALASEPPDVCLISSRDFCGLDPAEQLAEVKPIDGTAPRAAEAFTVGGKLKAVPDEFAVQVLFYNPAFFDQAGIGYPGPHWTWDVLESDARALTSLKLTDAAGKPVYALELMPSFDLWNILCAEAGTPALDLGKWHLADSEAKDAQMRALELMHELFQEYAIMPPVGKGAATPGALFAQQRVAVLIASSDLAASLPAFDHKMTVLPRDLAPATVADVNGWAVTATTLDADAALALAQYLACRPVHAGWAGILPPATTDEDSPAAICHEALAQALVPRVDADTARMAQFMEQQMNALARTSGLTPETLYARIQAQLRMPTTPAAVRGDLPTAPSLLPAPKADASSQVREL